MMIDVQTIHDLVARSQQCLRERLQALLSPLDPGLRADVTRALREEGKLLWQAGYSTDPPPGVWGLLPLLVTQHLSPDTDPHYATSVAIAVEVYICALDLLDDIEDDDQTPVVVELGVARVLSVATTLLFLSQQALLSTAQYAGPVRVMRLIEALSIASLTATSGQHRDILTAESSVTELTPQVCVEILTAKSGSLMSLACRLGALCAGASAEESERWAHLGKLLGVAHQLDNDAHGTYDLLLAPYNCPHRSSSARTSAARNKKTLPVVLAAQIVAQLHPGGTAWSEEEDQRVYHRALQEAIVITGAKAVLCREHVRAFAGELEVTRPLPRALRLLLGLPAMQ